MRERLSEPSDLELVYDLSAVLIHKGTAVNSGHYVAHIKDENTGQWWEFDDEHVSNLGHHPFGEGPSSSADKPVQTEPSVHLSSTEQMNGVMNGNHINVGLVKPSECSIVGGSQTYSSSDAYMLMYNLRRTTKSGGDRQTVPGHMEIKEDIIHSGNDAALPAHLYEEVKELNASYLDACQQYKLKKEREVDSITERRQEVRSVLSEGTVLSLEDPYYWISMDWLRLWADNITPP